MALDDIDLTVAPGETVAVIGPNGSGKSTLLKLVAGILRPSIGTVEVSGRVTALIELGAGFHPEITGRENVVINGMLLGLSRREIERRMAEIIAFSGIGPFIDQPVKTYSSGMYVRLGFAVAVSVEPDMLLIDEVLAVGDEAFAGAACGVSRSFWPRANGDLRQPCARPGGGPLSRVLCWMAAGCDCRRAAPGGRRLSTWYRRKAWSPPAS